MIIWYANVSSDLIFHDFLLRFFHRWKPLMITHRLELRHFLTSLFPTHSTFHCVIKNLTVLLCLWTHEVFLATNFKTRLRKMNEKLCKSSRIPCPEWHLKTKHIITKYRIWHWVITAYCLCSGNTEHWQIFIIDNTVTSSCHKPWTSS